MSSAVERTLDLIARSRDADGDAVLREALGRRDDRFGVEAALAIGRHGSTRLKNEVVRSSERFSPMQKDALRQKTGAFAEAVVHAFRSDDPVDRRAAVHWIAATDDFERFPMLVQALIGQGETMLPADLVPPVLLACEELVERMFDLTSRRDALEEPIDRVHNAAELRNEMASALVDACGHLGLAPEPQRLVEWTLILVDAETTAVHRLLNALDETDRSLVVRVLLNGTHPGVMRLGWELLRRSYPIPVVFDVWRQRNDMEFICFTLDAQPAVPTNLQIQNLAHIDYVPWLVGDQHEIAERLQTLPPALLPSVVNLLELVALPERQKTIVLRWLLENGDGQTRTLASAMFDLLGTAETHQIIADGLNHEDVTVQAWATAQLRPQEVPNAVRMLIERLDSPEATLRDAAREELKDYNFAKMRELLETEPARVNAAMGRLILKINPDALDEIRLELAHAIRGRRIASLNTVVALELCGELLEAIAALLEDTDMLVRRTAAEAIGNVPTRTAITALERARNDESVRVREAATIAMQTMRRQLILQAHQEAEQQAAANDSEHDGPTADRGDEVTA